MSRILLFIAFVSPLFGDKVVAQDGGLPPSDPFADLMPEIFDVTYWNVTSTSFDSEETDFEGIRNATGSASFEARIAKSESNSYEVGSFIEVFYSDDDGEDNNEELIGASRTTFPLAPGAKANWTLTLPDPCHFSVDRDVEVEVDVWGSKIVEDNLAGSPQSGDPEA